MSETASTRPKEETVVAVQPGLKSGSAAATGGRAPRAGAPWLLIAALVLLVAAGLVFFVLPDWVEQRAARTAAVDATAPPAPVEPSGPVLSPEELAALEAEAEALLADLLPQQAELGKLSADAWGGEAWARYESLARQGDDAYLAEDFATAVTAYRDAFATGEALLARAAATVADALAAGDAALEAGEAALAIEQYDTVLGVEPEHPGATRGRARAERLPEILALMQSGDAHRRARQLEQAAEDYRAARAIDPEWQAAGTALEAVNVEIAAARFERFMSQGLSALAAEDYAEAQAAFQSALRERPGSAEARDGLTEAQQGLELDQIALAEARALAFERRELWQQAIAQYRAALETDQTLAFAREGLARAQGRADLEAKLLNLIDNPDLLLEDAILAEAQLLAAQARALVEPDTRLEAQVERLDGLLTLATTPISVELISDALTEVTVYRVGELGVFTAKSIDVRPGTYTVVGSRRGYRDVRETFTVLPGREPPRVAISCVEPI